MVDAPRCMPANDESGLRWGSRFIVITGANDRSQRRGDDRSNDSPGG